MSPLTIETGSELKGFREVMQKFIDKEPLGIGNALHGVRILINKNLIAVKQRAKVNVPVEE